MRIWPVVLIAALLAACQSKPGKSPALKAASDDRGQAPYKIRNGSVFIPGWDDSSPSAPQELLRIRAEDFEAPVHLYRGRAGIQPKDTPTKPVRVPKGANEMVVVARARPAEDLFPWMEVKARVVEGEEQLLPLYSGYVLSQSLQPVRIAIPANLQGKNVRFLFRISNYAATDSGMEVAVAYVALR